MRTSPSATEFAPVKLNPLMEVPEAEVDRGMLCFRPQSYPRRWKQLEPYGSCSELFGSGGTNATVILSSCPHCVLPPNQCEQTPVFLFTGQGISIKKSSLAPDLYEQASFHQGSEALLQAVPPVAKSGGSHVRKRR